MGHRLTILGRIVSTLIFVVLEVAVQVTPDQIATNLKVWFGETVGDFLAVHYQFIEGFMLAFVLMFWFGPYFLKETSPHDRTSVKPIFFSPFGTYTLGQVNVYEVNASGMRVGRTLNFVEERDQVVRIKRLVPWLLYRVELVDQARIVHARIKRSSHDSWQHINFGLVG